MAVLSLLLCALFSSFGRQVLLSRCSAQASYCGGASCRAQALGPEDLGNWGTWAQYLGLPRSSTQARYLWHMDLVAPQHVGSSWTRDRTHVSWTRRWVIYHWATKEATKIFKSNCTVRLSWVSSEYLHIGICWLWREIVCFPAINT